MAGLYDAVDFKWSDDGDFCLGDDGDLADTSEDQIQSLRQEILSICKSNVRDWFFAPRYAAELTEFVGQPNRPNTAAEIKARLFSALTLNRVVAQRDLYVRVVPVRHDAVMCVIGVEAIATENNSLASNGTVTICFMLDVASGTMVSMNAPTEVNLVPVRG
jgi:hypothetical protein